MSPNTAKPAVPAAAPNASTPSAIADAPSAAYKQSTSGGTASAPYARPCVSIPTVTPKAQRNASVMTAARC